MNRVNNVENNISRENNFGMKFKFKFEVKDDNDGDIDFFGEVGVKK